MEKPRIVQVREDLLAENRREASELRAEMSQRGVILVNIMSSPGSGKTSLILRTLERLAANYRTAVIEADIDSTVDADKVTAAGVAAVQIETGGFCHVEAAMTGSALEKLDLDELDLVLLENVGNLICTAQHDTGAHTSIAILSVPEGDDKPLKYPPMFIAADAVLINKTDYLPLTDFNMDAVRDRIRKLNPGAPVIPLSCRTGEGVDEWISWLEAAIARRG